MTLLSVGDFRLRVASSLDDATLGSMLAAAEQVITAYAGPVGAMVESLDGGGSYLFLTRRAASIEKVTETVWNADTVLDPTDYRLRLDGVSVLRLRTGSNPPPFWGGQGFYGPEFGTYAGGFIGATTANQSTTPWGHSVRVEYTPLNDVEERKRVQAALVQHSINYKPGLQLERIGEWEERHAYQETWTEERDAILASLQPMSYAPGFA